MFLGFSARITRGEEVGEDLPSFCSAELGDMPRLSRYITVVS